MSPQPNEIYWVTLRWRDCEDRRPCVVLDPPDLAGKVTVALVSGQMDLYKGKPFHFLIRKDDPDFGATGLGGTSYVAGDELDEVDVGALEGEPGRLEGELAAAFRDWI